MLCQVKGAQIELGGVPSTDLDEVMLLVVPCASAIALQLICTPLLVRWSMEATSSCSPGRPTVALYASASYPTAWWRRITQQVRKPSWMRCRRLPGRDQL